MNCKIFLINVSTQRKLHEQIDESLVNSDLILGFTFITNFLHSVRKLKELVMTLPSWFPRSKWMESG